MLHLSAQPFWALINYNSLRDYTWPSPRPVRRPEEAILPWPSMATKSWAPKWMDGHQKAGTQCIQCRAIAFTLRHCRAFVSPLHYSVSGPLFSVKIVDIYAPCLPHCPCLGPVDWCVGSQEVLSERLTLGAPGIAAPRSWMLKVKW